MAFVHGKSIFVLLNGYNITGYLNKIDSPYTADTAETSTFGNADKTFIGGMKNGTFSAEGLFDGAVAAIDEQLDTILSSANIINNVIWFPTGNLLGAVGYGMQMIQTAYAVTGTKDDAVKISIAGQSNVGRERLIMTQPLTAKVANGSHTAVNNTAPTTLGGSAYIELTAETGNLVNVKIEHSSDNFAADTTDLVVFTQITAANRSERIVIPATTTIKQYTRVTYTLGGGTATFAVALHRQV